MSRPRVIKDNNGVAVVEGTPAASLVKDVDKFFATKPPKRMAGESVYQPRKLDPRAINTRRPTPKDLEQMNNPPNISPEDNMMFLGGSKDFDERTGRVESGYRDSPKQGRRPSFENLSAEEQAEVTAMREKQMEERRLRSETGAAAERQETSSRNRSSEEPRRRRSVSATVVKRKEAKDKAESRRKRFFERRRSRKEAERSEVEQEATQGKFITTLGR